MKSNNTQKEEICARKVNEVNLKLQLDTSNDILGVDTNTWKIIGKPKF